MASGKNKTGRDAIDRVSNFSGSVSNVIGRIEEDNSEQAAEIYLAQKNIVHNGKVFAKGETVTVTGSDLERLIKLGAVKLQDDGFPRVN